MRFLSFLTLWVCLLFTVGCDRFSTPQPNLLLSKDNKTEYFIVSPNNPTPDEATAIAELSKYLKQMTGATFPVVAEKDFGKSSKGIFVGNTQFALAHGVAGLSGEEWLVKQVSKNLLITGGRPRGSLYAVWVLLDSMGCTWASRDSEYIPRIDSLIFSKPLAGKPTIRMRNLYTAFYEQRWDYSNAEKEAEQWFRQRNGMNAFGYVGELRFGGGDYGRPMPNAHTIEKFYCSYNEYFATNPDFFAMGKDGKRIDGRNTKSLAGNLCYSSEGARQVVLKKLLNLIEKTNAETDKAGLPRVWLYDISQGDNSDWCSCPKCLEIIEKEGANSATQASFINKIAQDVAKVQPEVMIQTMGYMPTVQPPKSLRPDENVVMQWIDWGGFSLPPDTSKPLREQTERANSFLSWAKISPHMSIWDYNLVNAPAYIPYNPVPVVVDDMRFYTQFDIKSFFMESEEREPWVEDNFKPLYDYMVLRLMFNSSMNVEERVERFMHAYYGPAAEEMQKLYNFLEENQKNLPTLQQISGSAARIPYITPEFYRKVMDFLAAAELKCKEEGDKKYLRHVRREVLRCGISLLENWGHLEKSSPLLPFDRAKLIQTLEEAGSDVLGAYPPGIKKTFQNRFSSKMRRFKNPLPLPELLNGISADRIHDLYDADLQPNAVEEDTDSPTGFSAKLDEGFLKVGEFADKKPLFGIYHPANKSHGPRLTIDDIPQDEKFHFYKLGRTTLGMNSYLYGHGSWRLSLPLSRFFDQTAAAEKNTYDVYVSAKFTGPIYVKNSATKNGFRVDRVILVRTSQ